LGADTVFEKLKEKLFDKFMKLNPEAASFLGLHDPYDWQLSRGDTQSVIENMQMLEDFATQMKAKVDYKELSDENKIDWHIIEMTLENMRYQFEEIRFYETNPNVYDQLGSALFMMITRDYAPLEKRIDAVVSRLEQFPRFLEEFRTRFEKTKPVKLWTDIAIETGQQFPMLLQFIGALAKGKVPEELQTRLETAIANMMDPLKQHMEWLKSLEGKTTDEWALGKKRFDRLIELRDLGMTTEEIFQLGKRYFKELKEQRKEVATKIDTKKTVKDVLADIEKKAPANFEEALEATRSAMEDAKQFLLEKDLATVYESDKLIVEETPAFLVPLIPFAALMMPSRFDDPMQGIYIVTRPQDPKNLGKHLNLPSLRNTAVHEAYPGHFLQGAISNRSSLIHLLTAFGSTLGTETVEGWAHYCEQMMMEEGFVTGHEAKLIQLTDAMWRAVRIMVDVRLSQGKMSMDEAIDMLVKEVGMSKEAATAEVRRYTQSPGYPLSYLLGKHMILALREEVKKKMGDKFSLKFFHDTITANGYLPISLLRKVFDQKIAKL
jgi:uncharacterized protein (DUF885 family)